jgi:orotate phosphoribosyltransferase
MNRPSRYAMPYMSSGYLDEMLWHVGLDYRIKITTAFLRKFSKKFDSIAVCGSSGLLVGPSVARAMKKNIILVRISKNERSHTNRNVEGPGYAESYVIVDDFIETGNTVVNMIEQIKRADFNATCLGVVSYLDSTLNSATKEKLDNLGITVLNKDVAGFYRSGY